MIKIPEEFFEEEVRCDFKISKLMKRTWAAEMKMLSQLQDFFKEHNLTYYADVGTLLGAVRHQGFVPWDDDIDIAMKREDYMRFLELSDKLPKPLKVLSIYHNDSFKNFHAVVSNTDKDRLDYDEARMEQYYGCPFIINIDIFPLDYISRDENTFLYQKTLYSMAYSLVFKYEEECDTPEYEAYVCTLEKYVGGKFDRSRPLLQQIAQLADRIASMCKEEDAGWIDYYPKVAEKGIAGLHFKEGYESTIQLPFECIEIAAPILYKQATAEIYGDYEVFVKGVSGHEYPFYKNQWEYFQLLANFDERAKKLVDEYGEQKFCI